MAKFVFGMNQSLDGYVDHLEMRTGPALFRHWIEHVRDLTGSVYGRRMYEVMRYWDEDRPEWSAEQHEFAAAWRRQPKWVVSRSLKSVGPNATLVQDDIEAASRTFAGGESVRLPSGAGHDAQILATIMPAGMLFVPSIGGISHHWTENTADADIVIGAEVFVETCRRLLARGRPRRRRPRAAARPR